MRRLIGFAFAAALCPISFMGCGAETSTTTEKTIETPQGETTVTTEKTIEQSGENPPPVPANP